MSLVLCFSVKTVKTMYIVAFGAPPVHAPFMQNAKVVVSSVEATGRPQPNRLPEKRQESTPVLMSCRSILTCERAAREDRRYVCVAWPCRQDMSSCRQSNLNRVVSEAFGLRLATPHAKRSHAVSLDTSTTELARLPCAACLGLRNHYSLRVRISGL